MTELKKEKWNALLGHEKVAHDKIQEIADLLRQNIHLVTNGGLMTGYSGIAVFFAEYSRYCGKSETEIITQLITQAFETVAEKWHPPSFCSGISGMLWGVRYLISQQALDTDTDFAETEEFLLQEQERFATVNDFDYLHGANGIFYYFLSSGAIITQEQLDKHIKLLEFFAQPKSDGGLAWESWVDIDNPKLVNNISLSHGISSIIIVLAKALQQFPHHDGIHRLLEGAVVFLRQCQHEDTSRLSLFPGYAGKDNEEERDSRLGWCYGDLGIAIALLKAGIALGRNELRAEGLAILRHAAQRRNLAENSVLDAGICHGAAGIAHIFNRMYQQTEEALFQDAAVYWYGITLSMANRGTESLAGYQAYNGASGWQNEVNLLEGIAGVGLALIAAAGCEVPGWDALLLID